MLLSHIFAELGHSVRSAEDGFSALVEIRQEIPDVVLSDLNMPGMSGFEFLSVVRRRFPGIHVIAMGGAGCGDAVQPRVATDAFYEKATSLGSLLQIVEAVTHPERPTVQHPRRLTPIWIQSKGHAPSGGRTL
jgi:CheY-like chemotaxis protein